MILRPLKLSIILAQNTFTEVIRDRILYVLVFFSLLFMGMSFAIGQLSYNEIFRLSLGLGLSSIHLCFMGLTIFLGVSLFYREIERKTIFTLLVRPISRWHYLLGKYLGLMTVLLVLLIGFMASFSVVQFILGISPHSSTYISFAGIFLESCLLLSVTFFFSSFCRPFTAISCCISFFLIGHWVDSLKVLVEKSPSPVFQWVGSLISYSFPPLTALNWRDYALAKSNIGSYEFLFGLILAFSWSLLFFAAAQIIFRRKDFE